MNSTDKTYSCIPYLNIKKYLSTDISYILIPYVNRVLKKPTGFLFAYYCIDVYDLQIP